jgi:hypothetical protein
MGATGEKPFFDGEDTFAPEARDSFTDPLSGLVGGTASPASQDFDRVRIAKPVQPDAEAVREMVNAALREDARSSGPIAPVSPLGSGLTTEFSAANPLTGQQPLGMLPQQRNWPSRPPQLLRQARRKIAAPIEADFEEAEDVRDAAEEAMPRRMTGMSRRAKPSSTSTGVIIAGVLMLLFAIVSIEFLVSLVNGISGLFH